MVQIIGTKKCPETRKALRFCRERSLEHQFVDLAQRSLSDGEWESIFRHFSAEELIDENGAFYRKEGYAWRAFDAKEELMAHWQLLRTPVLRSKGACRVGCDTAFLLSHGAAS
ncbi:MAG: arsenate reductase family protein [Sphaerochaetaceae bacterium]|jgi:arsenate reductase-like glutaredoxin family protein